MPSTIAYRRGDIALVSFPFTTGCATQRQVGYLASGYLGAPGQPCVAGFSVQRQGRVELKCGADISQL